MSQYLVDRHELLGGVISGSMLSHGVVGGISLIRRDSLKLSRDARIPASSWANHWGICARGTGSGVLPLEWRKIFISKRDKRNVGFFGLLGRRTYC